MSHARQGCVGWLAFSLLSLLPPVFAFAQPAATLVVPDASALPGQTASVTVVAQDVQQGIVGIQGRFRFDPSVLRVTEVSFNEAFKVTARNILNDQGEVRFVGTLVMETDQPIGLFEGPLFTFQAQAVGQPGDSSEVALTLDLVKNMAHEVLTVAVKNGRFTIEAGENQLPIANFTFSPERPKPNETVTFTDASTDPDGRIVRWLWDFGDGETLEVQTASQRVSHSYSAPGSYAVTLTVTDDRGGEASLTKSLTVRAPFTGDVPEVIVFPNPCRDHCTFRYQLPEGTTAAALRIFNVRGALVFAVGLDLGRNEFRWDLRDDAGQPLPNGPYFFFVVASTPQGPRRSPVDTLVIQR